MRPLPESLAVLQGRDFRLLFLGQSISLFGDGIVRVALPFAVLAVGGSASEVGLVLAAFALPLVASLLVGGVVADRVSRRGVMMAADAVRLVSQAAMAALLIAGEADVWTLALLAGLGGAATGFFQPAATGLLPAVVDPERLQSANGLRATSMAAGEIAGPIVAGLVVASAGAGWAIAVDAASFAASAAFLSLMRVPARGPREASTFRSDLAGGWREVRSRTWVWSVVLSVSIAGGLWAAFSALGPVAADRGLGGAAAWGAILAALGAGALAGALLAIRLRPRRPLVVVALSYAVLSVPLAGLASGAHLAVVCISAFLAGLGMMLGNTVWESALQRRIPDDALSRVSAYEWFGSLALRPLGLALWGPLAAAIGLSASLWLAFLLEAGVALALLAVADVRGMREPVPARTR